MKKETHRKPESFIRQPNYPGGKKALDAFIKENLRYPEQAIEQKVEGSVTVAFDLDVFGEVSEVRIKHGIGYGCDEEAIRLVSLLKYEKKKYKGFRVVFHNTMTIHFRLNEASKVPPPQQTLNYQYSTKPKPPAGPPGTTTYEYKVNL